MLGQKRNPSPLAPQAHHTPAQEIAELSAPIEEIPVAEIQSRRKKTVLEPAHQPTETKPLNTEKAVKITPKKQNLPTQNLFYSTEATKSYASVLEEVQHYMSDKHATLMVATDEDMEAHLKRYIRKYLQDYSLAVADMSLDELVDTLYTEMAEFGFLTKYIFGSGIEEININSWDDVRVQYSDGSCVKLDDKFDSPQHAINVMRRMLHSSGMVLDNASPIVLGHLSKNIRISVMKTPVVDEDVGVSCSIRIVNPQNIRKEDFIKGETATSEMLDLLSACIRYGVSTCIAGATSSGKTTVAGWLLTTIPDQMRIFTIENGSRELDLVRRDTQGTIRNNVIHTLTRSSEQESQTITQDALLDMSLRFNPDIICVGEMRSAEAYAAQEASRTGHTVLTTIHSNSCESTHHRMMTLCKRAHDMKDDTLLALVAEAFPIIVFAKKLEDTSRKIMQIMECMILPDGTREYVSLYQYHISDTIIGEHRTIVTGEHRFDNQISMSLQQKFIQNGMPKTELEKLLKGALCA